MDSIEQAIAQGMSQLALEPPPGAAERLAAYLALLARWNRAYNLTAVRTTAEMVSRHVLDSLAIAPWVTGPRVLDVGSGAGLPGIPLAIVRPALDLHLLDASAKRTRFMVQALAELGLTNAVVERGRVEALRPALPFDTVVSRAFGSLAAFLAAAGPCCAPGGRLLAMKGARSDAELAALPPAYRVEAVHRLSVPGLEGEQRHLIQLSHAP